MEPAPAEPPILINKFEKICCLKGISSFFKKSRCYATDRFEIMGLPGLIHFSQNGQYANGNLCPDRFNCTSEWHPSECQPERFILAGICPGGQRCLIAAHLVGLIPNSQFRFSNYPSKMSEKTICLDCILSMTLENLRLGSRLCTLLMPLLTFISGERIK